MIEYYLAHHGIKGQKWGVRRYQNPDGTLTDAGRKKYQKQANRHAQKAQYYRGMSAKLEAQKGWRSKAGAAVTAASGAALIAGGISFPVSSAVAITAAFSAVSYASIRGISNAYASHFNRMAKTEETKVSDIEAMIKQNKSKSLVKAERSAYKKAVKDSKAWLKGHDSSGKLPKIAKKAKDFDDFDSKVMFKYGDMPGDIVFENYETRLDKEKKKRRIS